MSVLGVDVSSYNGIIDWRKVKSAGYDFAILKIIKKNLGVDSCFEYNWESAQAAGIEIKGVYNYSYATGIEKAVKDARAVIKVLNGRETTVWLDMEDECQKGLGYGLVSIINAYQAEIENAGLKFGLYTGLAFYNSYLKKYANDFSCPLWIARYGKNNGTKDSKYQPQLDNMVGWQYTSRGRVNGIQGNVDLNVFYTPKIEKVVVKNPYPVPERVLSAKKVLGRFSCRGDDVKYVQYSLYRMGYLSKDDIDGIYGYITEDAVKRLQKAKGIAVDGIVGVQTRRYL